ncbi:MAG: glycine--tRNA ligase subunit beta [Burkholderiales bacterium]
MARGKTSQPASASLLVELLTEELPPKALKRLSESFAAALADDLRRDEFLGDGSSVDAFATPRRLAVTITHVRERAPDRAVEFSGPSVKVGLDASGHPTPALLGFARKHGVDPARLARRETPKGEFFFYQATAAGGQLAAELASKVEAALKRLPVPKMMRWGAGDTEFVRPVHGLVMLHGSRTVKGNVLGAASSNRTDGHRFLSRSPVVIQRADDYEKTLRDKGRVIVQFEARRRMIVQALDQAAGKGAKPVAAEALLDEITALVEFPAVFAGEFSPRFLDVPQECLILSMQQHQKYVPLREASGGKLLPRFLFVSNLAPANPREIVHGNERVLHARLSDAKFFFDQDRRTRLEARVPRLSNVVYHNKLGTQLERVERIQLLAGRIARAVGTDAVLAERAAWLSKADLLTEMVGEFPELQGVMGSYYAHHDGEPAAIVSALADQYRIRYDDSSDPGNLVSAALYLADRVEALIGLFGVGEKPTGDRDPFALRRAALGIISVYELLNAAGILAARSLPDVQEFLEFGATLFPAGRLARGAAGEVHDFILERYWHQLAATSAKDVVEAVISRRPPVSEITARVRAVETFRGLPEAESLAAANKRIRNILRKSDADSVKLDASLLREPAERELHSSLQALTPGIAAHMDARDYTKAMQAMAALKGPVDAFFDKVLVNAEDEQLRNNRHALLRELDALMNGVADISKLAA